MIQRLARARGQSGAAALAMMVVMLTAVVPCRSEDVPEFHAFLLPSVALTEPGSLVTVAYAVDSTGVRFNAYRITIQFDPGVLSFVSVAEGALMLGGCPSSRFKRLTLTDSTVTYQHSLLCADSTLHGPGELSRFTFRGEANGLSALALVTDPDSAFYDAGRRIWPGNPDDPRQVVLHDGMIVVGPDPTSVPGGVPSEVAPRVDFRPNPTRGEGSFRVGASGPVLLEVVDVTGRRVLSREWTARGPEEIAWRFTGPDGRPLAGGVYFARLQAGSSRATSRIVLVR